MQSISLSVLNTSSYLLALAVKRSLPKAIWADQGTRGITCYADFFLPTANDPKVLEEAVQQSLRILLEESAITVREMIPGNAWDYLKHRHGFWSLTSEEKTEFDTLVSLLEWGKTPILAEGPLIEEREELVSCRLWKVLIGSPLLEDSEYQGMIPVRFIGYATSDKADLSFIKKTLTQSAKSCNLLEGQKHHLFLAPDTLLPSWVWLPKGILWREQLLRYFEKEWKGLTIESYSGYASLEDPALELLHTGLIKKRSLFSTFVGQRIHIEKEEEPFSFAWSLYRSSKQTAYIGHISCFIEHVHEQLISSLQMIEKNYKMFGVETCWVLRYPKPANDFEHSIWNKNKQLLQKAVQTAGIEGVKLASLPQQQGPSIELCTKDKFGERWTLAGIILKSGNLPVFELNKAKQQASQLALIQVNVITSLELLIATLLETDGFKELTEL